MIICDSNIWYDLHEYPDSEKKPGNLVITPLVTKEISNSPKIANKFEIVRKACENIFKYANDLIIKTPLEYLLDLDNQTLNDTRPYQTLANEFEVISRIADGENIIEDKRKALEQHIESIRKSLTEGTSNVQQILNQVRENIKDKKAHRKQDTIELTKQFIKKVFVENPTNNQHTLSENFDWSKIELFLYTLDAYFTELEVNTTMKIYDNDWVDIFNMLYVTPNDKYFTKDGTWIRMINTAQKQKYLINSSET